jgi:AcrR family transcriptional regulator
MDEEEEGGTAIRDRILAGVDRLFYAQGIKSVGVDAIAADLGISKKTLYRHFPSKDDLVIGYLRGRFQPLPETSTKPPAEQILANLESIARSLTSAKNYRGCAFLNVLAEFGSEDSELRELAVTYKESRRLWYRDLLSQLDVDDPDTLATQLALLVDGAYAAVLIHQDPGMVRPAIAAARTLLKAAGVAISAGEAKPAAVGAMGRKGKK